MRARKKTFRELLDEGLKKLAEASPPPRQIRVGDWWEGGLASVYAALTHDIRGIASATTVANPVSDHFEVWICAVDGRQRTWRLDPVSVREDPLVHLRRIRREVREWISAAWHPEAFGLEDDHAPSATAE